MSELKIKQKPNKNQTKINGVIYDNQVFETLAEPDETMLYQFSRDGEVVSIMGVGRMVDSTFQELDVIGSQQTRQQ